MSTRAIYTFRDNQDEYHVYKHSDGYPSGAAIAIENALAFAWELPRFEADEFAAGFVAGNKMGWEEYQKRYSDATYSVKRGMCGGGIRLLHSGNWKDVAPPGIEYRYEVFEMDGKVHVSAFTACCDQNDKWESKPLYTGTLNQFKVWARRKDKAA